MTRADFDNKFATCVSSTGAAYLTARDAIKAAGAEVNPWIAEHLTSSDWRKRVVAEGLQLWRQFPDVAKAVGEIARAGGNRLAIPAPTVTGYYPPTRAATSIWSYEEDVVPRLIELVLKERTDTPAAYEDALLAIAYAADPRAAPALVELLGKSDGETNHMMVIAALGEIADAVGSSAVLALGTDPNSSIGVRSAALVALGQMGALEAVAAMLGTASNPSEDSMLRTSAIAGLGHLGDKLTGPAIAALAQIARGTDEWLALNAIHSLRSAGTAAARTALAALQQNAATTVAQSAARDASIGLA